MQRWKLALVGLLSYDPIAHANSLMAPFQAALNVLPPVNGPAFTGLIGDASISAPTWTLQQWNNPQPIVGLKQFSNGTDWTVSGGTNAATNAFTIFHSSYYNSFTLTTNVQTQNSSAPNYISCGPEVDFSLASNGYYSQYNSTYPAPRDFDNTKPVGQLGALTATLGMSVPNEVTNTRYCGNSYASYGISFTLNNIVNGQALFYQITIRDSRGPNLGPSYGPVECVSYPRGNPAVFCVSTGANYLFGYNMPSVGGPGIVYNLNILPGLVKFIQSGLYGMDANPNNWVLDGVYLGQGGLGDFNATSIYSSFSLNAY